jgi:hypothetical protein
LFNQIPFAAFHIQQSAQAYIRLVGSNELLAAKEQLAKLLARNELLSRLRSQFTPAFDKYVEAVVRMPWISFSTMLC